MLMRHSCGVFRHCPRPRTDPSHFKHTLIPMHAAMGSDVLQLKGKVITYTRAFLADPGSDYGDYFNPANEFFNYRCSNT